MKPIGNRGWVLVFVILAVVSSTGWAYWNAGAVGRIRPWLRGTRVFFEPAFVDFGTIGGKQIEKRHIVITNRSGADVTILGVQKSCQCMMTTKFPQLVRRGEQFTMPIRLGTPGVTGHFQYKIKIFTDSNGMSGNVITVSGNVDHVPSIALEPEPDPITLLDEK